MKKLLILISMLASFVAVPAFGGLTVTTTGGAGYGIWQTGSGGEFTLKPVGFNFYIAVIFSGEIFGAGGYYALCGAVFGYYYANVAVVEFI